MRSYKPLIAAGIAKTTFTIAVTSLSRRRQVGRARLHGLFKDRIDIFDVQVNVTWQRRSLPLGTLAAAPDHDHRSANVVFSMESALRSQAIDVTSHAERLLEKFTFRMNIRHDQVRRDRAKSLSHAL